MGNEDLKVILVKDLVHVNNASVIYVDEAIQCMTNSELSFDVEGRLSGLWDP